MNFEDWFPLYLQITDSLKINRMADYESSILLRKFIHNSDEIIEPYRGRNAFIVGNGKNLKNVLGTISGGYVIVADSAIETYNRLYGNPDMIDAYNNGSFVFVHAHGDNMPAITKYAKYFSRGIATTQYIPMKYLYNYGGFSDGDRSAFLADHLGAPHITLLGFDFKNVNMKPNYDQAAVSRKKIKLLWAEYLLGYLAKSRGTSMSTGDIIEI